MKGNINAEVKSCFLRLKLLCVYIYYTHTRERCTALHNQLSVILDRARLPSRFLILPLRERARNDFTARVSTAGALVALNANGATCSIIDNL